MSLSPLSSKVSKKELPRINNRSTVNQSTQHNLPLQVHNRRARLMNSLLLQPQTGGNFLITDPTPRVQPSPVKEDLAGQKRYKLVKKQVKKPLNSVANYLQHIKQPKRMPVRVITLADDAFPESTPGTQSRALL